MYLPHRSDFFQDPVTPLEIPVKPATFLEIIWS